MKVSELLQSINAYPIPANVISEAGIRYGLELEAEATQEIISSSGYKLAKADVYAYLAGAPDVTQNGISFSFSDKDKQYFLNVASSIRKEEGVEDATSGQYYGYVGEDL